jgi:hypothetical protein
MKTVCLLIKVSSETVYKRKGTDKCREGGLARKEWRSVVAFRWDHREVL